jgi:hypothetical protein
VSPRDRHRAIRRDPALLGDTDPQHASWNARVRARRDAAVWRLADLLLGQPVIGVITEFTDRKRNRFWQAPK